VISTPENDISRDREWRSARRGNRPSSSSQLLPPGGSFLVVTRMSPFPPVGGVALRVAATVRALSALGEVDVLIVGEDADIAAPEHVRTLRTVPPRSRESRGGTLGRVRHLHPRRHPFAAELFSGRAAAAIVSMTAGRPPGVVVLEELWLGSYLDVVRSTGWSVVYDAHNVEAVLRQQIAASKVGGVARRARQRLLIEQVRSLEQQVVVSADQVWTCSDADRDEFARLYGRDAQVHTIPNTVDVERFAGVRLDRIARHAGREVAAPAILYLGDFGYAPNGLAAEELIGEVLPRVRRSLPEARLLLVGKSPTATMLAAAQEDPGVTVTGVVADLRPWLLAADVLAVPLRVGGGTRLKILEAFSAGIPVVSTTKGAEGLEVEPAVHLLIADAAEDLAEAVLDVLRSPERARALAEQGHEVVVQRYSWAAASDRMAAALGVGRTVPG
jgi:polysaccharide biosynthesis protein PslH